MITFKSPFANIYKAIKAKIAEEFPQIAYVDFDYGQLDVRERPAVAFPCLLVDFHGWKFEDLSEKVQHAEGMVTFKISTDPYSGTDSLTPETYSDDALFILELEWNLYNAFDDWNPGGNTGPLSRVNLNSDNRRVGLKTRILTFSHAFQDYSAKKPQVIVTPPPLTVS